MDFQKDLENYPFNEADEEKITYDKADSIFSLLMFIFGYLSISWVLLVPESSGLGAFLLTLAFSAMALLYLRGKKIAITKSAVFGLVGIDLISLSYVLSANETIKFFVTVFVIVAFTYWMYCAAGNREEKTVGDMLFFDLLKSVFVMPFSSFGSVFGAAKGAFKNSSFGKKVGLVIIGVLIAIVPTTVITILLLSADDAFVNLTDDLFSDMFTDLPKNIWYFLLGIPVAMYAFGMLISNATHKASDVLTRQKNELVLRSARVAPAIITCAAITPIIFVYILFFLSQTTYFLSAFSGIRPEGITYAEYARKGFFELCTVSVINMVIIVLACLLTKRTEGKRSPVVGGYVITLSAFTLVLIAIALSKIFMYIDAYGLTRLRVYTTWFMLALVVLFVFIIVRQCSEKFNLFRSFSAVAVAMFAILVFADVDAMVAKYNVDCYRSGKLDTVDIDMMYDLSDSAVQYVVPLMEDESEVIAFEAKAYVETKRQDFENREDGLADFNLATHLAKQAVKK